LIALSLLIDTYINHLGNLHQHPALLFLTKHRLNRWSLVSASTSQRLIPIYSTPLSSLSFIIPQPCPTLHPNVVSPKLNPLLNHGTLSLPITPPHPPAATTTLSPMIVLDPQKSLWISLLATHSTIAEIPMQASTASDPARRRNVGSVWSRKAKTCRMGIP